MKYIITKLSFDYIFSFNAKELITTTYATVEEEKYELKNGTIHTNLKSSVYGQITLVIM